jgi:phosphoenolpyruvate---glycerone phosphotransferase subunit DhaL
MQYFINSEGAVVLSLVIKSIQENKDYLGAVDGEIGDGDHGVNMNKGFSMAGERIEGQHSFSDACKIIAEALMDDIGGSMGPLYGSFFKTLWRHCRNLERIDAVEYLGMLKAATTSVKEIGGAKVGDKTLVDTLEPACAAFEAEVNSSSDFDAALAASIKAAGIGRDSTKEMIAQVGRSARLGERSRGVLDAGAASSFIIIESMHTAIRVILHG